MFVLFTYQFIYTSIITMDSFHYAAVDDDENNDECMTQSSPDRQEDFTLLGDYWDSVCTLALTLELPEESNNDGIRMLKVLNNSYGVSGNSCFLRITDAGVI